MTRDKWSPADHQALQLWKSTPVYKALPWLFAVSWLAIAAVTVATKTFQPALIAFLALTLAAGLSTFTRNKHRG